MENKKRVLLLGHPASIHIFNYVKNVLCHEGFEVVLFNFTGLNDDVPEAFRLFYSAHNVKLIDGLKPTDYGKKGYFRYLKKTINIMESLGPFDICHEHYIKDLIAPAIYKLRHLYGRIILTYYGSDLYRTNQMRRIFALPSLLAADRITLISGDMMKYFNSLLVLKRFSSKCTIIDLGNMFYDSISSLNNNKEFCKATLGLDPNKLLISLGYVGRPQMQQFETLQAIVKDNRIPKDRIQFVIPAYGITDENYDRIQSLARTNNLSFKIFKDFMGENDVTKLRVGTDVFIHAQTTDALSCAMLEHLYAGSVVVNGSWLRYETLVNNNVYFKSFDDFSTLCDVLVKVIDSIDDEYQKSSQNRDIIASISSWESLRPLWLNAYA